MSLIKISHDDLSDLEFAICKRILHVAKLSEDEVSFFENSKTHERALYRESGNRKLKRCISCGKSVNNKENSCKACNFDQTDLEAMRENIEEVYFDRSQMTVESKTKPKTAKSVKSPAKKEKTAKTTKSAKTEKTTDEITNAFSYMSLVETITNASESEKKEIVECLWDYFNLKLEEKYKVETDNSSSEEEIHNSEEEKEDDN